GPLAAHLEHFARSLGQQGYTLSSIHRQIGLATCFSRWLKEQEVALRSITADHPLRYLRYRARQGRRDGGNAAALRHLLAFLRGECLIPAEKVAARPRTPTERWTSVRALPRGGARVGESDDRQLYSVRPQLSPGSF